MARRRGDRWADRAKDEAGEVTSTVIVFPALLVTLFVVVQFALAFHAKSILTAAAQDASRAAQAEGAGAADGEAVARAFVATHAGRLVALDDLDVAVTDDERVHAEVRGRVASVVPGLRLRVEGVADGPRERFVAEADR